MKNDKGIEVIDKRHDPFVQIDKSIYWFWARYIGLEAIGLYGFYISLVNKEKKYAFPNIRNMADFFGMSHTTIIKLNKILERSGLIKIQKGNLGNQYYILNVPPLPVELRADYHSHKIIKNDSSYTLSFTQIKTTESHKSKDEYMEELLDDDRWSKEKSHVTQRKTPMLPVLESHVTGSGIPALPVLESNKNNVTDLKATTTMETDVVADSQRKTDSTETDSTDSIKNQRDSIKEKYSLELEESWTQLIRDFELEDDRGSSPEEFFYKLLGEWDYSELVKAGRKMESRLEEGYDIRNPRGFFLSLLVNKEDLNRNHNTSMVAL